MELGEVARLGTIVAMTVLARPERERVGPPEAMAANAPHVGAAAVLDDGRAAGRAESDLSLTTRDATELVNIRARQRARGGPSRGSPLGRLGTRGRRRCVITPPHCLGWPLDPIPSAICAVLGQAWRRVFARRKDASNALLVGASFSCSYFPRPRRREVVHFPPPSEVDFRVLAFHCGNLAIWRIRVRPWIFDLGSAARAWDRARWPMLFSIFEDARGAEDVAT